MTLGPCTNHVTLGRPCTNHMRLDELNALDDDAAARELLRCCGSPRWARQMAAARPFRDAEMAADRADAIWWSLEPADWQDAFAAHPKIGAGRAGRAGRADEDWSAQEQSGVEGAAREATERLAVLNRDYETRFGYIFIVCATGRSAGEMIGALERRLGNAPDDELRVAAEEQRRITRLRLARVLQP
jgi:2-oxo-4-hydroxy-4-carboxy-5-ureidoimidazoline decarboxylase